MLWYKNNCLNSYSDNSVILFVKMFWDISAVFNWAGRDFCHLTGWYLGFSQPSMYNKHKRVAGGVETSSKYAAYILQILQKTPHNETVCTDWQQLCQTWEGASSQSHQRSRELYEWIKQVSRMTEWIKFETHDKLIRTKYLSFMLLL
jgi:hypothetical protein